MVPPRTSETTSLLPTQQQQQQRRQQQRQQLRRGNSFVSRLHRHSKVLLVAGVVLVATALSFSATPPPPDALPPPPTIQASAAIVAVAAAAASSSIYPVKEDGTRDMLQFCEEKYIAQELDHFRANGGGGTYQQRYFVCAEENFDPKTGAIFFYAGNEADVTLYLNNTGLMWENAKELGALIVFAEHRYFGKSIPFGDDVLNHMEFLSSAQALADYAVLIQELKDKMDTEVPVIGFGGSYGGMLCTWFRLKYPHIVDGVIAASAPILAFMGDKKHPVDTEGFQRGVTFDMSEQAGSAPNCVPNVRRAFASILRLGKTDAGRRELAALLRVCDSNVLETEKDVSAIVDVVADAYGNLAMGNYPYPTSYITSGESFLPAFPVRAACEHLKDDFAEDDYAGLLAAFRESFGVFLNSTKQETCFFPKISATSSKAVEIDAKGNFYSYIECAELYAPFSRDNVRDAFPAAPVDLILDDANCFAQWKVRIRLDWAVTQFGSIKALHSTSNIVFSNGKFDPWSTIGINESISDSVVYLPIEESAHHLDLFFTHPLDPPAVTQARQTELTHIRKWISEFYSNKEKNKRQQ